MDVATTKQPIPRAKAWHVWDPTAPQDSLLCAGLIVYAATRGKACVQYCKRTYTSTWRWCDLRVRRLPEDDYA